MPAEHYEEEHELDTETLAESKPTAPHDIAAKPEGRPPQE